MRNKQIAALGEFETRQLEIDWDDRMMEEWKVVRRMMWRRQKWLRLK